MTWQFSLCLSIVCLGFIRAKSIPDFRENEWKKFKVDFHKNHGSEAEGDIQQINQHNERSYVKKIDEYTDMDDDEIANSSYSPMNDEPMYLDWKKTWDWTAKNVVTKVKNQEGCENGDWAFAAIGALEGLLARNGYNLTDLSEQELIDCTEPYGNYGCESGTVKKAFDYIKEKGICTNQSYPYTGTDTNMTACPNKLKGKIVTSLDKMNQDVIPQGSESLMKQYLYQNGPILAIINASQESFMNYKGGIYHDDKCAKVGKHNVLIVGYDDKKQGEEYWIVKNSWGEEWGEYGYVRIARGKNTCGIATNATFLTLTETTLKPTIFSNAQGTQ
ncbi:procathepsin L-like isoform X2 [Planococcus citri]|uniref:procathepsin L-like isoform X2 n=1 Tax=Planococcus citri TaxID=170843 RepID=UPI0031F8A74C